MIVLIGASASGKTEVAKCLLNNFGYKKIITTTTREKRVGEEDDVSYHFINKENFLKLKNQHAFIEDTVYRDEFYGLQFKDVDSEGVVILEPLGANVLVDKNFDVFVVYLKTRRSIRKKRMIQRGDSLDSIKKRLKLDSKLFKGYKIKQKDLIIKNNKKNISDIALLIHESYQEKRSKEII